MNDIFHWDDSYNVGVADLDHDHQHLLSLGNAINRASAGGKEEGAIRNLLGDLMDFSAQHFAREEVLMRKSAYPQYEDHRKKHGKLHAEIQLFIQQYDGGQMESGKLADFLIRWIFHHIQIEDMKFQEHFNNNGIH